MPIPEHSNWLTPQDVMDLHPELHNGRYTSTIIGVSTPPKDRLTITPEGCKPTEITIDQAPWNVAVQAGRNDLIEALGQIARMIRP